MDCLEGMNQLDDESVDLVVTSPPYNLGSMKKGSHYGKKKGELLVYGEYEDNMEKKEYESWQRKVLLECYRVIKDTGAIFYNHKPRIMNGEFDNRYNLFPIPLRQEIIWYRGGGINFCGTFFVPNTERIYLFAKNKFKIHVKYIGYGEVWNIRFDINVKHPASFPLELPKRCILSCTEENDIILDPFMGSGTTAVACKQLNRNFIGFEINKEYCDMANIRLNKVSESINKWF